MSLGFKLEAHSQQARAGVAQTARGLVHTPAFMPVATQGSVKALSAEELNELGAEIVLSNAYHLYLRPGHDLIADAGGLHRFMNWPKPILTDSGGFQVVSLPSLARVTEDGVVFRSHIDGSEHIFTPEKVLEVQMALGVDIAMVLDEPVGYPTDDCKARDAMERSLRWGRRSRDFQTQGRTLDRSATPPAVFGITHGATFRELRAESARRTAEIGFDGYAIGGLSLGEPKDVEWEMLEVSLQNLPAEKPRYLMGVGHPSDIVEAVARGVDLFDCALPTRLGRNGSAYTFAGRLNLKNARFARDFRPLEDGCECSSCRGYTRAYIRHLLKAQEMLGARLMTLHNLYFYLNVMRQVRQAILANRFADWRQAFYNRFDPAEEA